MKIYDDRQTCVIHKVMPQRHQITKNIIVKEIMNSKSLSLQVLFIYLILQLLHYAKCPLPKHALRNLKTAKNWNASGTTMPKFPKRTRKKQSSQELF